MARPGERIAADGEVEFGESAVDRSMMTGESVPAGAAVGDLVAAGTVVRLGRLVVRADKVGRDTHLAHLVAQVAAAPHRGTDPGPAAHGGEDKYCIDIRTRWPLRPRHFSPWRSGLLEEHLGHCVAGAVAGR